MLEPCVGRKIELHSHIAKDSECVCEYCKGTGFVIRDDKWLEECTKCEHGIVPKCEYCGKPRYKKIRYGSFQECENPSCKEQKEQDRIKRCNENELKQFEKATKWNWDNVPKDKIEFLYHDYYGYNDGYFSDIDELEDYCKDNDIEMPKYVYCTRKIEFSLDAYDWIENSLEESYEDAIDCVSKDSITQLQNACDEFVKKNNLDSYSVDYTNIVVLENKL